MRTGGKADAVQVLGDAVAQLDGKPGGDREPGHRAAESQLRLPEPRSRSGEARADLVWCRRIATENGHDLIAAKALHNLGYCDLLAGDIPGRASAVQRGRRRVPAERARISPRAGDGQGHARCSRPGSPATPPASWTSAMAISRRRRLDQNLCAEAQLARAQAALAAGELAAARRWAAAAQRRFRQRGNLTLGRRGRAHPAARPVASPRAAGRRSPPRRWCSRRGCATAGWSTTRTWPNCSRRAPCSRPGSLDAGQRGSSRRCPAAGPTYRWASACCAGWSGPSWRSRGKPARGGAGRAPGGPGPGAGPAGPARQRRPADRHGRPRRGPGGGRPAAGAGAEVGAAGVRLAGTLAGAGVPGQAGAAARRPAGGGRRWPSCASSACRIREAELNGERDPAMAARQAELRREIREHDWKASGLGEATAQASLGEVSAALEESGQTLVGIVARPGEMIAVVAGRGRARLVRLGDFEAAAEAARRLNADLDTLAGRRLPARLETVIRESIRHQARPADGRDHRAAAVARSATAASCSSRRARWPAFPGARCPTCAAGRSPCPRPRPPGWRPGAAGRPRRPAGAAGTPLLVAGPDLEHAAREVTEIARCYPGCRPLLAETATVSATLRALDGAPLAHLAAHGHHDQENFLFSQGRPGRRPADGLRHPAAHGRSPARGPVLLRRRADRRAAGRGDPRLHRGPALHRHRHGDRQRHPGGRRRRRRHDDRLPSAARGRDQARRGARRGHGRASRSARSSASAAASSSRPLSADGAGGGHRGGAVPGRGASRGGQRPSRWRRYGSSPGR